MVCWLSCGVIVLSDPVDLHEFAAALPADHPLAEEILRELEASEHE